MKNLDEIVADSAPQSPDGQPQTEVDVSLGESAGLITTRSLDIKTLDDALRVSKVDLNVWEVERYVINSWEVTMKHSPRTDGESGKGAWSASTSHKRDTYTNYQVKVWLIRKIPSIERLAIEELLTSLAAQSRTAKPVKPRPIHEGRYLLEISLFDAHFGMLSWNKETGENYNLKVAERRYADAVTDLLAKTSGFSPERIIFPIGQDFFHVNNPEGYTPQNHNKLDVDGRLAKVFEVGTRAVVHAVDECARRAPVEILWVPGNHDPETSYYLCRVLEAWYRNNPNIVVDVSPAPRKYRHYGVNLIGFTHGNEEKHADLPAIMAAEQRAVWASVSHCEWHLGHFHKQKETRYSAGDTYGGVRVRVIAALTSTDSWHFRKGYVKNHHMAEAFIYEYSHGFIGEFCSKATK